MPVLPAAVARSSGAPRESLDWSENLPKEAPRQVVLGQLEDEVPVMSDEAPAGLAGSRNQKIRGVSLSVCQEAVC